MVGAQTRLGFLGPKHYAVVLGRKSGDGRVYVAERNRVAGYRLLALNGFEAQHGRYAAVRIEQNKGKYSDAEVAQRALDELLVGGEGN